MAQKSLTKKFAAWYGLPEERVKFLRGKERDVDGVWFYGHDTGSWYTRGPESWIEMADDVIEGIKSGRYGERTGRAVLMPITDLVLVRRAG